MGDSPPPSPLPGHSVSSLNSQLLAHGFAKRPLRLDALSDTEQVNVTSVLVELLGANVTNLNRFEDLSARHRTLQFEWERLSEKVERQSRSVAKLEHEVSAAQSKATAAEARVASEERESAKLRHEVERGRKALDTLRVAAAQETKRCQLAVEKLTSSSAPRVPKFELLNPIAPGKTHPVAPGALPLLEAGIVNLDALRQSAQEEAGAFRHVVLNVANGLRDVLAQSEGRECERWLSSEFFETDSRRGQAASWTSHPSIADAKLRRLLDDVRERLLDDRPVYTPDDEEEDPEAAARERERLRREQDLRDRVKDLEVEVSIAQAKESEASRALEDLARANAHIAVPSATDFEDAKLREELVRQKRVLDAERAELAQTEIQIREERLSVQAEREAWDTRRKEEIERVVELELERREREREEEEERAREQGVWDAATKAWGDSKQRLKHQPARPSPLSPRKQHVKKRARPSLQRLVVEKQHQARAEQTLKSVTQQTRALKSAELMRSTEGQSPETSPSSSEAAQAESSPPGAWPASAPSEPSGASASSPPPSEGPGGSTERRAASLDAPPKPNGDTAPRRASSDRPSSPPAPGVLSESTNTDNTPGVARLLQAGISVRKPSGSRPRRPPSSLKPSVRRTPPLAPASKPPIAPAPSKPSTAPAPSRPAATPGRGMDAARDAHNPRKKSSLEAAGIRRPPSRASTASNSDSTPAHRRLMAGTAASLAKSRKLEKPTAVWK